MEIIVRGQHFDVPDHVETRLRHKLARLEHYLPLLRDAAAEVDMAHEKAKEPDQRYVVHVTVSGHGVHLQAEERAARPEAAVDQAVQVLSAQARRQKQRLYERGRKRAAKELAPQLAEAAPPSELEKEEQDLLSGVARVKRFPVKPMTTEEAVEELELLGHDFFLFYHGELEQFALLYRRRAGNYGLIIPELS
ncbi:MAG: ribosomal subunit interface protein [Chloroflexi bacterium RBG_16_68_14]|nr:MAG: ribosomal subunit interface protein [Chloroflexi bacterium RBG_16_68_14]